MRKENVFIGFAIAVIALAIVFFASYIVTEQNRESSVERLRAKAIAIQQKTAKQSIPETHRSEGEFPERPIDENDNEGTVYEDTIATYKEYREKVEALESDPHWKDAFKLINGAKRGKWTEAEREQVAVFLEANREYIIGLRQLMNSGGPFWKRDFSNGVEIPIPNLLHLRRCANLLTADATLATGRRDYETAVTDLTAIMKMADALREEPVLITQMIRLGIVGIMYGNITQTIKGEDLPPELAGQIIRYAANANERTSLANSFAGEALFGLEAFEGIRTGDLDRTGMSPKGMDAFLMRAYGSLLARPFLNLDEEAYADIIGQVNEVAQLPFYEAMPEMERISHEIENLPRTRVLTRMALPSLTRIVEQQARYEAQLGLMQVGLAVEQYHGQNGNYPETLDEIAPTLGGAIPMDPFTGQPFVYEPHNNSFTLYSVSGNGNARANIVWREP